jgi:hypothetical protein
MIGVRARVGRIDVVGSGGGGGASHTSSSFGMEHYESLVLTKESSLR